MRARWWLGFGLLAIGLACAGGPDTTANQGKKGKKGKKKAKTEQVEAPAEQPAGGSGEETAKSGGGADTPPPGITAMGGDTWQVERKLVDKWEDKPERLALVSQKGKGFVLKKVGRKDARFLGFKNGDVLKSVNGKSLGSPAEAAAAYAQLSGAKTLKVKFRRDGAARTHTYKIVD
jgi:hypothetical protein